MTPTGWIEAGEHLPPLAGWRARRVVSGELEIEAPGGARHVLGSRGEWERVLGAEHRGHHVPELVQALVEAEEARIEAEAREKASKIREARQRSAAAYNALAKAEAKGREAPKDAKEGGT